MTDREFSDILGQSYRGGIGRELDCVRKHFYQPEAQSSIKGYWYESKHTVGGQQLLYLEKGGG